MNNTRICQMFIITMLLYFVRKSNSKKRKKFIFLLVNYLHSNILFMLKLAQESKKQYSCDNHPEQQIQSMGQFQLKSAFNINMSLKLIEQQSKLKDQKKTTRNISKKASAKNTKQQNEESRLGNLLKSLVINQMRLLIEASLKIVMMHKRQNLLFDDLLVAMEYLGLKDLMEQTNGQLFQKKQNDKQSFVILNTFIKTEYPTKNQQNHISGRWIFLNGKIPNTYTNRHVSFSLIEQKAKSHIKRPLKQNNSKQINNNFKIYYKPELIPQQQKLLIQQILKANIVDISYSLCFPAYLPFFIKSFLQVQSSCCILILLRILETRKMLLSTEYYIHQLLWIFMNYKGSYAWEVGLGMSRLIRYWIYKYPMLPNLLSHMANESSSKLKIMAYCVYSRLQMKYESSQETCCIGRMQQQGRDDIAQIYKRYWIVLGKGNQYIDDQIIGVGTRQYLDSFL